MSRPRLIVVGPLPPPYHGVTVSTALVLANPLLRERFAVEHADTSDHRSNANLGAWDVTNMATALKHVGEFATRLRGRKGVAYIPISQGLAGFVRDALFIAAASAAGWKVAVHLRGSEFRELFYDRQPRPIRAWIRWTLRRIDSLAVMGTSLRGLFDGMVPPDRIAVVPNGTPDPELPLDSRDEIVLFLSNLRRRKGVAEGVEAARIVADRHPSVRFLFVGEWEDERLEQQLRARAEPYGDRIRFLDTAVGEEKRRLLGESAVLLFPPVEPEGHPRVVLEAIAAGMPVVTTDRGAIAETVIDGESGFVLAHPVPEQLADRLLRLFDDPGLRVRMAAAARARYEEAFTQERADEYLADWLAAVARG